MACRSGRPVRLQYACAALTATDSERGGVRVTLAHDYLLVLRGAERTFAAMADAYPGAPIATLLYDEQGTGGRFAGHPVTTSLLQRLGARQSDFRRLLPLYPPAAELLRAAPADVLLSSSSAFAHGIHAPAGAVHVCYCHAPFRYVWNERDRALHEVPAAAAPASARPAVGDATLGSPGELTRRLLHRQLACDAGADPRASTAATRR